MFWLAFACASFLVGIAGTLFGGVMYAGEERAPRINLGAVAWSE